jgi:hypothetical protein
LSALLLYEVGRSKQLVQPPRDLGVAARTNRVLQDAYDEPIPRFASGAGHAVHRSEQVIGHGYRSLAKRHWYSSW